MYEMLRKKSRFYEKEVIEFAADLVKIPSPSLSEERVARLVESRMQQLGYDKVVTDDFGNVVGAMLGREAGPTLLLNCHMDTVDAVAADKTGGEIQDGKLFGWGASDCKAGLAAQVYSADLLRRSMLPLKGNLVVAATVAEENGGSAGVFGLMQKTLPSLGLKPDYAVLGEPTDLGLYYGHDGCVTLDVTIESDNQFQVTDTARAIFSSFRESGTSTMNDGIEKTLVHQPYFESTGDTRQAVIQIDRRINHAEDEDDILGQVQHQAAFIARSIGNTAVSVMVKKETHSLYTGTTAVVKKISNAWSIDPFHQLMERSRHALSAAGCDVRPGKWALDRLGMGTAGGVLVDTFKVPAVGYGPGCESAAHSAGEWVDTRKINEALYGTAVIAHSLIGIPVFGWTSDDI
jgi:acetylornithine deacetylase/succinyl-diaminopimelate desuccinylase-like protein